MPSGFWTEFSFWSFWCLLGIAYTWSLWALWVALDEKADGRYSGPHRYQGAARWRLKISMAVLVSLGCAFVIALMRVFEAGA